MYDAKVNRERRTISARFSGFFTVDEVRKAFEAMKWAIDSFRGQPHLVLADIRGLAPLSPDAAIVMAEMVRYGREHGTACCVHLSDSSIARLQANRVAREVDPQDAMTVNVVSLEHAERVIDEKLALLLLGKAS